MKIAFIGLGQMGKGMALNMLKSGAELIVCSRRGAHFPLFEGRGAKTTVKTSDTAAADIIFLCLPDSKTVKTVICQELLPHLHKGQILVDFSTIDYKVTMEIAGLLEEKGARFIDAPVSGLEARANDGTLTIMCGGQQQAFDAVKGYLSCVGSKIFHMGGTGNGQLAKLVNQLFLNIHVAAAAEIMPMAAKMGLDCEKISEAVNSGTGRSFVTEFFVPRMLKREFSGGGLNMKTAYKDMVSAAEIAAGFGIPMPVAGAATTTYQMALLNGLGDCDKGGMVQVYEKLLNVEFVPKPD